MKFHHKATIIILAFMAGVDAIVSIIQMRSGDLFEGCVNLAVAVFALGMSINYINDTEL